MIPFLLIKVTSEVSLGYVFYLVCTRLNKQSFELVVLLEKRIHDCRIHPLGTKNVLQNVQIFHSVQNFQSAAAAKFKVMGS